VHDEKGSPSYEQAKVTDGSLATNSNRAARDVDDVGGTTVNVTLGARVSGGVVAVSTVVGGGAEVRVAVATVVTGGTTRFCCFGVVGRRRGGDATVGVCVPGGAAATVVGGVLVAPDAGLVGACVTALVGGCDPVEGETALVAGAVVVGPDGGVGADRAAVVGLGAVSCVVRPRSVAAPTPLATRSTAAPVATTTAVAPRGRRSAAHRDGPRQ
jgi:hypothetical protein